MIECRLKELRVKYNNFVGISQKDLSIKCGIRLQTISDMETNKSKAFGTENLNKLCIFFNCSVADILVFNKKDEEL